MLLDRLFDDPAIEVQDEAFLGDEDVLEHGDLERVLWEPGAVPGGGHRGGHRGQDAGRDAVPVPDDGWRHQERRRV